MFDAMVKPVAALLNAVASFLIHASSSDGRDITRSGQSLGPCAQDAHALGTELEASR
jgi:hypothetical protein